MSLAVDAIPPDAPDFVAHRLRVWNAARAKRDAAKASGEAPEGAQIVVSLPDGSKREAVAGKTTPMEIAMGISETLGRKAMTAEVDGKLWDMDRPLEAACTMRICTFSDPEGKLVLWHSTAHMMGEAMEMKYKGALCIGPPIEDGFYYDICVPDNCHVSEGDFDEITKMVDKIAKEKRTFERMELTKEEALDMFEYNKFKCQLIEEKGVNNATITAYRDGPFIDLCKGPHVPQTNRMKAWMVKSCSQAFWKGDPDQPSLQRIYGISFPDKKLLKEHKRYLAEMAKRDHRVLGPRQELFMFHQYSPGCPFLLPMGQRIFNRLLDFMRDEYWKRGYLEVQTPNMFNFDLWHISGHAANYKSNMYQVDIEKEEHGLKPMNCPSHCLIFASRVRSHRELPLRIADFGVLHRNELSGSLGGLTRVRRFQQDDAHIFCLPEQVRTEVFDFLQFLNHVYGIFGFRYELELSTRPEKAMGTVEQWEVAEDFLAEALIEFTGKQCGEDVGKGGWKINPADGAFYGPKIDIKVFDALKRPHQCATLQLDFQLPIRFNLQVQAPTAQPAGSPKSAGNGTAKDTAAVASDVSKLSISESAKTAVAPPSGGSPKSVGDDGCGGREIVMIDGKQGVHIGGKLKPGFVRPVIIHRALYGSLERFFAVLLEHYGGFWPFWLSPRQAIVIPVSEKSLEYGKKVQQELRQGKYYVEIDSTDRKMPRKLVDARNNYFNVVLVVGESEMEKGTVMLKERRQEEKHEMTVAEVRALFDKWRAEFSGQVPPEGGYADEDDK